MHLVLVPFAEDFLVLLFALQNFSDWHFAPVIVIAAKLTFGLIAVNSCNRRACRW